MFRRPIKIGVFCGFGLAKLDNKKLSERDFAYRILCALDSGSLKLEQAKPKAGDKCLCSGSPIPGLSEQEYKFTVIPEWSPDDPNQRSINLIEESDVILAIFPRRKKAQYETSVYTMLETATAHGRKQTVLPIVEAPIKDKILSMLANRFSWPDSITRENLENSDIAERLKNEFDKQISDAKFTSEKLKVYSKHIEDAYKFLIETLVQCTRFRIYNHSALPLGSRMDPFKLGQSKFTDYQGVFPQKWSRYPYRAMYFELEEALCTGHWERVDMLLNVGTENKYPKSCPVVEAILNAKDSNKRINLDRTASVISGNEYVERKLNNGKKMPLEPIARIISIVAQLWRLQNHSQNGYQLTIFPAVANHSTPTTLYADLESASENKLMRGMWGFLRGPAEDEDWFVIAQNDDVIKAWQHQVDRYFGDDAGKYEAVLAHSEGESNLSLLFKIIGKEAAKDAFDFAKTLKMSRKSQSSEVCMNNQVIKWYEDNLNNWL